uniref:EGF-like domain-containing protein n=1 Tax=Mesocestoides corti TaxID=53468 RepID=A0A5K3F1E8_MESCO
MGGSASKDEAIRGEIGCDSIGTVLCSEPNSLECFEGVCALFVAETEKRCVERCKCYPGYFGSNCQFRDSSLFATAGIVGGIIGIFVLIFIASVIWCCWRRLNGCQERGPNGPGRNVFRPLSNTAPDPESQSHNSLNRPRSGLYEHELNGDFNNDLIIDQNRAAIGPDGTRETAHLLEFDGTDGRGNPTSPHQPPNWRLQVEPLCSPHRDHPPP